jgi:hypothetical protein
MLDPARYKGFRLEDLVIEEIEWSSERAHHIRTRSERHVGDTNLEPEWATEAVFDGDRVLRVSGRTEENSSVKVIGYSPNALGEGRLLKVWIWTDDPPGPTWSGGSASLANDSDQKRYEET